MSEYFSSLRVAAASAAERAHDALLFNYEAATVSATVTSQVTQRPSGHGIMSVWVRPGAFRLIKSINMLTAWRHPQLSLMTRNTHEQAIIIRPYYYIVIIVIIITVSTNLNDRWVRAPKCLRHAERVAALNCHRKTLT